MSPRLRPRVAAVGTAATATTALRRLLDRRPPGGAATWTRTNHAGEPVTLLEGPAVVVGIVAATVTAPELRLRTRLATGLALGVVGGVGAHDDLQGSSAVKGLRGHLTALRHRQVTSGALKMAVIGGSSLVAAGALREERGERLLSPDTVADGVLVAGLANLVNLLDLRPGRALKASLLATPAMLAGPPGAALTAAPVGAATAALPDDLAGASMLGDCGANTVGAAFGCVAVGSAPRSVRRLLLAAVVGLTLASEKVSFSAVIESHPWLRRLDLWGRPDR